MSDLPAMTTVAGGGRIQRLSDAAFRWLVRQERRQDHAVFRLRCLAWIGCFAMPLYYAIWAWWFPQPYESLALRALGMLLCVIALIVPRYLGSAWLRVYEFVGITYVLPFFFTFMFLMNRASAVWAQSLLVALVVLFQFDWWWAVASCASGVLLACAAFAMAADPHFLTSPQVAEQVPIYLFTIVVVSIAKVGRAVLAREKLAGMAQALAMVSHELRTPLLSVSANVRGIERTLAGRANSGARAPDAVLDAVGRIQFEVVHMNKMIDLFLLSATALNKHLEATELVSMASVVSTVIDRYPFASPEERARVEVVVRRDFVFAGRHELGVVLLLNLLRNALKALQRAGRGRVRIVVDGAPARRQLLVLDTGCGIPAGQVPHIFERFVSYPANSGAGIGLALCRDIVQGWKGRIRCRSRESAYTAFALEFPDRLPDCPP
jgi:two-component system CAI-1 autoinducer sensor kinase/phosphatase CqsS